MIDELPPPRAYIEDAAKIAVEGRGAELQQKIEYYAGVQPANSSWHFQLFASIAYQISSEYDLLKRAFNARCRDDASLLAWRARNLLELMVWTFYFCRSEQNARRMYEDAGRDSRELFDKFVQWGKVNSQPADWLSPLEEAKGSLLQRAAAAQIESLDGDYLFVGAAAKKCGIKEYYDITNKFLSKFAHPTAMQIMAPPNATTTSAQRHAFFAWGCFHFCRAFDCLETYLAGYEAPWRSSTP